MVKPFTKIFMSMIHSVLSYQKGENINFVKTTFSYEVIKVHTP